jgi:hypothetical protein
MKDINYDLPHQDCRTSLPDFEDSQRFLPHCQKSLSNGKIFGQLSHNQDGQLQGNGSVQFPSDSECTKLYGVVGVNGSIFRGLFHGSLDIQFLNETILKGTFCHGKIVGISRYVI